jgi:NDP-sugar pyrophosphorylase family protein
MGALTDTMPKPMLEVAGRNLIEHKLDVLPDSVDEVILIVGYLGRVIQEYFGGEYKGKRIRYVEQEVMNGTGGALWDAKDVLKDRFLVLNGDDIYAKDDLTNCIAQEVGWSLMIKRVDDMQSGGNVEIDDERRVIGITEGNHTGKPGNMNMNVFVLDSRVFQCPLVPKMHGSPEYGLPQTVLAATSQLGIPLVAIEADFWIQITAPEDLARAEKILADMAS